MRSLPRGISAILTVTAVLTVSCGSPGTSSAPARTAQDIAADQAAVNAAFGGCTSFSRTGCPMTATTTSDGHGGDLIAVGVQVTGDDYQAAIFFDNTKAVGQAGDSSYKPFGPRLDPKANKYERIAVAGTGKLAVVWFTWSKSHFSGFCCPNGPPVTWTYQWNGHAMQVSGHEPSAGYAFF